MYNVCVHICIVVYRLRPTYTCHEYFLHTAELFIFPVDYRALQALEDSIVCGSAKSWETDHLEQWANIKFSQEDVH